MVTLPTVSLFTRPVTVKAVFPVPLVKVASEALTTFSAVMVNAAAVILAVVVGCVTV